MGYREAKVEKYFDSEVKRVGAITRKWVSPGHVGVPDRLVIARGVIVAVEIKTESGTLSSPQVREHNRLKDAGMIVETVYGHAGVDDFVTRLENLLIINELYSDENSNLGTWAAR